MPTENVRSKIARVMHLKDAIQLVWRSSPILSVANAILTLIRGALPLASLYIMKLFVDAVTSGAKATDKSAAFGHVVSLVGLWAVIALFTVVVENLSSLVSSLQGHVVTDYMYGILQAKSLEADLEYYENSDYYDTLHRAQAEAPYRPLSIVNGLISLGRNIVSITGIVGLLLVLNPLIAGLLIVAAFPKIVVRLVFSRKMYDWQRKATQTERRSYYYNLLLTTDTHAKELRVFGLGSAFMSRFRDIRTELRVERFRLIIGESIFGTVMQIGSTAAMLAAFALIGYQTIHAQVSTGALVMYYQAFQSGQGALNELLGSMADLYKDNLFLSYLREFLRLPHKVVQPLHPISFPSPMREGIVFDHVSFQYPTSSRPVIEGISFSIPPGEVVALVGANGAGKTTIIKLLCRLYDPVSGRISVDGIDIREFDLVELRRQISVIFQDYSRYNVTAWENVWFGNVDASSDRDKIVAATALAGVHDVVAKLPNGYDTILGKWFEDGEELSVGEWQKIALARAFLRDAQLIVLDEPTSAMDAKAEYEFFLRFRELVKGRSALLISHRFSTVRMADRIYVISDGTVIESGSHDELVQLGGTYAHLFEIQASRYR